MTCHGSRNIKFKRPFRFEAAWFYHPECTPLLKNIWERNPDILSSIEEVPRVLEPWNKERFGNIFHKKKILTARINGIQKSLARRPCHYLVDLEKKLIAEFNDVLRQEEIFWFQKSRVKWIKDGDRNTKFFHKSTLVRRKRNNIQSLKIDNIWTDQEDVLQQHANDFYAALFSGRDGANGQANRNSLPHSRFQSCLPADCLEKISQRMDPAEVKEVLFSMHPFKAPGPDGLHARFYQRSWEWLQDSLVTFAEEVYKDRRFNPKICEAFLCLIPKIQNPETIAQFRPISLCNVLYKFVTKSITTRLHGIMPDIISPTQSSFIKGRSTQDNIFLLQEVLHSVRSKKKNKVGCMIMKLDLEKAYDKINWEFLEETLIAFKFPSNIVELIMFCVTNASTRVLWNGTPLTPFKHACGLRQGDPLSPYLFVLCVERLAYLIQEEVERERWQPLVPCRGGPRLSHLFFADDLVLMGRATKKTAKTIREVLDRFCGASGLKLSAQKSKVFFSKSEGSGLKRCISEILGFGQMNNLGKYLGISLIHGRVTRADFAGILDRIMKRFSGWKGKLLTLAGRATLIQSVSSALPVYHMQASWIPENVCLQIDRLNRDFLWSSDVTKKKLHLVGWPRVTKSKREGGLGIKLARVSNEALLSKLAWRIMREEDTVWRDLIVAKYLKKGRITECIARPTDSATWKGIIRCVGLMAPFLRWKIGNGKKIKFWFDNWIGDKSLCDVGCRVVQAEEELTLCEVIDEEGGWLLDSLESYIPDHIRAELLNKRLHLNEFDDKILWSESASGEFSCRSAYFTYLEHFSEEQQPYADVSWVWKLDVSNKIQHFLWLVAQDRLATNEMRRRTGIPTVDCCPVCSSHVETSTHMLRHCKSARQIWRRVLSSDCINSFESMEDEDWIEKGMGRTDLSSRFSSKEDWIYVFAAGLWVIWRNRNAKVFKRRMDTVSSCIFQIKLLSHDLKLGRRKFKTKGKEVKWHKPDLGWVKLNTDGGVVEAENRGYAAAVMRTSEGSWLWGVRTPIQSPTVDDAEMIAIKRGLTLAWERRYPKVILETDSLTIFKKLTGLEATGTLIPELEKDCRQLMKLPWEFKMRWIPREANKLADMLGRSRLVDRDLEHFWEYPPSHVSCLYEYELV